MSQHFLLSRSAKTLTLAQVFQMSDAEAEATFAKVRWPETNGEPVCPKLRRRERLELPAPDWRAAVPLPSLQERLLDYVGNSLRLAQAALAGLSRGDRDLLQRGQRQVGAGALARLGTSYKAAFVLAHKLREAMAEELKGRIVGGAGKVAEVDGGYFGGYIKPANLAENRVDRRLAKNQNGKRKVVVIVRERNGNSVPAVFRSEGSAQKWIKTRIAKGTVVNADEATSWDGLHASSK